MIRLRKLTSILLILFILATILPGYGNINYIRDHLYEKSIILTRS